MAKGNNRRSCIVISAVALVFSLLPAAHAAGPDEEVPPPQTSTFGAPPARVKGPVSGAYALRMSEEQDATDLDIGNPKRSMSRSPASANQTATATGTDTASATDSATRQADIAEQMVQRGVQEVSVIASDLGYFPKTIFVTRDVPVRMYVTSSSKNTLCIMMDAFQVRRQVRSQKIEEIGFVPAVPGKYRFYCPVNGMEGTLVVKEFSSTR